MTILRIDLVEYISIGTIFIFLPKKLMSTIFSCLLSLFAFSFIYARYPSNKNIKTPIDNTEIKVYESITIYK